MVEEGDVRPGRPGHQVQLCSHETRNKWPNLPELWFSHPENGEKKHIVLEGC